MSITEGEKKEYEQEDIEDLKNTIAELESLGKDLQGYLDDANAKLDQVADKANKQLSELEKEYDEELNTIRGEAEADSMDQIRKNLE